MKNKPIFENHDLADKINFSAQMLKMRDSVL